MTLRSTTALLATLAVAVPRPACQAPIRINLTANEDRITGALLSPDGQWVAYAFTNATGIGFASVETLRVRRADASTPPFTVATFNNGPSGPIRRHSFVWRREPATGGAELMFVQRNFNNTEIRQFSPVSGIVFGSIPNPNATDVFLPRNPFGNALLAVWQETQSVPTIYRLEVLRPAAVGWSRTSLFTTNTRLAPMDVNATETSGLYEVVSTTTALFTIDLTQPNPVSSQVAFANLFNTAGFLDSPGEFYLADGPLTRRTVNLGVSPIIDPAFDRCSEAHAQPSRFAAAPQSFLAAVVTDLSVPSQDEVRLVPPTKSGHVRVAGPSFGRFAFVSIDAGETRVCFVANVAGSGAREVLVASLDRELVSALTTSATTASISFTIRVQPNEIPVLIGAAGLVPPFTVPGFTGEIVLDPATTVVLGIQPQVTITQPFNSSLIGVQLFYQAARLTSASSGSISRPVIARFF